MAVSAMQFARVVGQPISLLETETKPVMTTVMIAMTIVAGLGNNRGRIRDMA